MAVTSTAAASPPTPGAGQPDTRHAIIFVPGLGDTWVNQSVSTIGAKIASALDNEATTTSAVFTTEIWQEKYGAGNALTTLACTIHRKDASGDKPVVDVFRLDSIRELRSRWESHNLLVKSLLPVRLLVQYVPKALRRKKVRATSVRERFQLYYAMLLASLITAYIGLVVYSIVAIVVPAKALDGLSEQIPQGVALALTLLGLTKAEFVKGITDGAVGNLSAMSYFRYGDRREQLVGNLARLVQHLAERGKVEYDRVDIVAYSFGTMIALDSFFPPSSREVRTFGQVKSLVTIGCPFDFVRTYWPHYFEDRGRPDPSLPWLNLYLPLDVLSSNFRNDPKLDVPEVGIPTNSADGRRPENRVFDDPTLNDKLGIVDFVFVLGLRSHDFYWGSETSSDLGVFPAVVRALYAGDAVLA
jgi:hypothetical protein